VIQQNFVRFLDRDWACDVFASLFEPAAITDNDDAVKPMSVNSKNLEMLKTKHQSLFSSEVIFGCTAITAHSNAKISGGRDNTSHTSSLLSVMTLEFLIPLLKWSGGTANTRIRKAALVCIKEILEPERNSICKMWSSVANDDEDQCHRGFELRAVFIGPILSAVKNTIDDSWSPDCRCEMMGLFLGFGVTLCVNG
jgi:hypothetical protein